ncbi:cell division protein ZapA [Buchnera aphidicola]|uniref:Cell division protein ZapA n=1 Tax=Buchnera aphidicola subsp. Tuberolachnus salignus TaxID=98804 RepID=A0A160SW28_BUCTT|nr:cell division protein ZapA [Buchnera aphidicola]CUR53247.1 Cell division protein ZapA [Buchnera aphidicola (Tuberolachnus salignus)]
MSVKTIDIEIFGRFLKVHCPNNNGQELQEAANNLNKRLNELKNKTGVSNTEQLVFITALNICHELILEKKNTEKSFNNLNEKMLSLKDSITHVLKSN